MSPRDFRCSMCGLRFDPDQHLACQQCPLHSGCDLVCCPSCGYQTIDPGHSKMVRLARFFTKRRSCSLSSQNRLRRMCLADVPPGCKAQVVGFAAGFPPNRKAYLQAYGLVLNNPLQVLQHKPVTILRVDQIELALESDLAKGIFVELSPDDQSDNTAG